MKERITITLGKEILDWLDVKIAEKVFANRSHGFEFLIKNKMDAERKLSDGVTSNENEGTHNDNT